MPKLMTRNFAAGEWNHCSRKIRYPNKCAAVRAGKHLIRVQGATNISAYYCNYCGGWHVGRNRHAADEVPHA